MTKSRGRELSCAFDAILHFVEIKSIEKAWLLIFWWQSLAWLDNSSCGQSRRLCAEDCLMSIWFVKLLWDQAVCCCASPWMQSVGGQQERDEMVWCGPSVEPCQYVDQAPNLLQCQAPTCRPSAEPSQYQAPESTPRWMLDLAPMVPW